MEPKSTTTKAQTPTTTRPADRPLSEGKIIIRAPQVHETQAFIDCVEQSFGICYSDEQRQQFIAGFDRSLALVALADGVIIATLAAHHLAQTLGGGRQLRTLALTDVGVLQPFRRRGVFRQLVDRSLRDAHRRGDRLCVLATDHGELYLPHGFGHATSSYSRSIEGTSRAGQIDGTIVHLTNAEALSAIPEVFAAVLARRPGELERPVSLIEELLQPEGEIADRHVLAYLDDELIMGYAVYDCCPVDHGERPTPCSVIEVSSLSTAAARGLWSALIEQGAGVLQGVELPGDEPIGESLAPGGSLGPVEQRARTFNRLVDLPLALESRGYMAPGSLTFAVADASLPTNSGRWRVDVDTSGVSKVARTSASAEISLSMATLATLFSGDANVDELIADPSCVAHRKGAEATTAALFAVDPHPYCTALC